MERKILDEIPATPPKAMESGTSTFVHCEDALIVRMRKIEERRVKRSLAVSRCFGKCLIQDFVIFTRQSSHVQVPHLKARLRELGQPVSGNKASACLVLVVQSLNIHSHDSLACTLRGHLAQASPERFVFASSRTTCASTCSRTCSFSMYKVPDAEDGETCCWRWPVHLPFLLGFG